MQPFISPATIRGSIADSAACYLQRGLDRIKAGDYAGAIPELNRALELDPTCAHAYYYRAAIYDYQENFARAIADCDQVIAINPAHIHAYQLRGWAYYRQGDAARAIADFDQVIARKPDAIQAYLWRGACSASEKNWARAIADFDRALQIKNDFAEALVARAIAFCMLGDNANARADLETLLQVDAYISQRAQKFANVVSQSPCVAIETRQAAIADFLISRAVLLTGLVDFDAALANATHAIKFAAHNAEAYLVRGLTYAIRASRSRQTSDRQLAIANLNSVIELSDDPELRKQIEEQLQRLSQVKEEK